MNPEPMTPEKALDVFHSLAEQCMGAGMFKKVQDFDYVRSAYNELKIFVDQNKNIQTK